MSETATLLPVASAAEVRAEFWVLLAPRRWRALGIAILCIAAAALGLLVPLSLGLIVDAVTEDLGVGAVLWGVFGVAAGAIAAALVALWGNRLLVALVQEMLAELRESVFDTAMHLPVHRIDDGENADLISRVTGDVEAVAEAGGSIVPTFLSAAFAVAVSLVALTALDPWLALAGLLCVPCYVIGTRVFLRRSRVVYREVRVREAARSQAVLAAVDGSETITALSEQQQAVQLVGDRALASISMQVEGARLRNRLFSSINGGEAIGLIAILAAGFLLYGAGAISLGMATTAALLFHRLFGPIGQVIFSLDDLQRATVGLARLVGVIDLGRAEGIAATERGDAGVRTDGVNAPRVSEPGHGVVLDRVSYSYAGSGRGISEVSFRVPAGTTTALVGASGSGKSTIARLIAGHAVPESGTISSAAGTPPYVISQEIHAFRGDLAASMRLAAPAATDAQIADALRAVGAAWALPRLAETPTGADAALDEGMIQQLAIARALVANPEFVILDEATAEVGLSHRAAVDAAVLRLREHRTVVLIAHQLAQVQTADQIIVCADGSVAQRGTHTELVTQPGPYRELWLAHQTPTEFPESETDHP